MTDLPASTLSRRAKTKNQPVVKRHRAKAAKLRREIVDRAEQKISAEINQVLHGDAPLVERPGRGEIVGGYLARKADVIAKMARQKGGVDAIEAQLMALESTIRDGAMFDVRQRERKAAEAVRMQMRDEIVCGLIASFDMALDTGTMPLVWVVNSTTLTSLVEALKVNGYAADGKS